MTALVGIIQIPFVKSLLTYTLALSLAGFTFTQLRSMLGIKVPNSYPAAKRGDSD